MIIEIGNMTEKWLEVHILFSQHQASSRTIKTVLLGVIKRCVHELRRRGLIKTYHYFFERRVDGKPGVEVLFRVEAGENASLDEIKGLITRRIEEFRGLIDYYVVSEGYEGEAEGYGKDGWLLAKKFFEIGSDIALAMYSEGLDKGEKFIPSKLIHCFLNQLTLMITNEERFYAQQLVGSCVTALRARSVTREVVERARRRLEEAIREMEGRPLRPL